MAQQILPLKALRTARTFDILLGINLNGYLSIQTMYYSLEIWGFQLSRILVTKQLLGLLFNKFMQFLALSSNV